MTNEELSKVVSIEMPLGHVLLAWETLSGKFSDLQSNEALSEEERIALWGLADVLERVLVANAIGKMPQPQWRALIEESKEFIKTIPVDFLD